MCGIFCLLSKDSIVDLNNWASCFQLLNHRGPNSSSHLSTHVGQWSCYLFSSVLWTQGTSPFPQPVTDQDNNFLIWNGDIYLANGGAQSDTKILFDALVSRGIEALTQILGPYAFIFYQAETQTLFFGRDLIGRQSLLFKFIQDDGLALSSVGSKLDGFEEVPSCGIFSVSLSSLELDIFVNPWSHLQAFPDYAGLHVLSKAQKIAVFHHKHFFSSSYDWEQCEPSDHFLSYLDMAVCDVFPKALKDPHWDSLVSDLKKHLCESVRRRVDTRPAFCKLCIETLEACSHPKIGILFSGGLDSTLLALIAHAYIPLSEPIDLLNVAFQGVRSLQPDYKVPDRQTGLSSVEELKKLAPCRCWNFIEINVTRAELNHWRDERISHLISPLTSVLDDSLGSALWFASRGSGLLLDEHYTSPARILLLGMGADEMFGGYSRHRKLFLSEGYHSLGIELKRELREIGRRNLARDNRVVGDHGVQPRLPYLDDQLVAFVDQLPPWDRCYLGEGLKQGIGDKFLLRLLAWEMGLKSVASLTKRAMQFGSRIADPKQKGHNISRNLL